MPSRETYAVDVAGVKRDLPLFEVAPGVEIAVLNILGDTELVQAAASALAQKLAKYNNDQSVLVTAEAKSIPLIYAMALETGLPYVVLRKTYKPYMGDTISAHTKSITTGTKQHLYLDEKDKVLLRGKNAILLDDVISTGSTLNGMRNVVEKAGATVVAMTAIFTEGDEAEWSHVVSLGHLPVFTDKG